MIQRHDVPRRIVQQESVSYEMPPFEFGAWPRFESAEARLAWLREKYAAYPAYLDLVMRGGVDFGGITTAQGVLL